MGTRRTLRIFLAFLFAVAVIAPVSGQRWKLRRYETGFGLGATQIFGDIGGTIDQNNWFGLKDIKFNETNIAVPLYIRYKIDPFYSIKLNGVVGFGDGSDENSRNDRGRYYKVLISEISLQGEYYFITEERRFKSAAMFNRRGMLNNYMSFNAYGFLGIGGVYTYARDVYIPDQLAVDDIRTHNFGAVIPFGLGLKYILDDKWLLGAELGYRFPFTDYVEGYKQTLNSKHNDVYYFLTFSVGYRLETTRKGIPGFLDREYMRARILPKDRVFQPKTKRQAID
ncbi:MAG: hypothetical protein JW801_04740 [Bacteroidales bacterium]|nr:hypothetical protein [Bacteroidales bacterium]